MSNRENNEANNNQPGANTMTYTETYEYDSIEAAAAAFKGTAKVTLTIEIPAELSWTDDDGKTSEWSFTGKTGTALKDGRPTAEYEEIDYEDERQDERAGENRIFIAAINGPDTTEILERVNF